jgi:hypothetical protein
MTASEYFSEQFYAWEYRGRGLHHCDVPVQLEPPFIPFFRHGYQPEYIDDGKRPTFISNLVDRILNKKKKAIEEIERLDYDTLELFEDDEIPELTALHIRFPQKRNYSPEQMKALLIMFTYSRRALSFEIIGNASQTIIQFVVQTSDAFLIKGQIKAYFPDALIQEDVHYLDAILDSSKHTAITDLGLQQEFVRPLQTVKNFTLDPLIGFFGILESLTSNEQAGIQILFQGTVNPWVESIIRSVTTKDGKSFFIDAPEAPKLAQEKIQSPLFGVSIRVFAQAQSNKEATALCARTTHTILQASKGSANTLIPIQFDHVSMEERIDDMYLRQSHRIGMLLNADELVTLVHFPTESIVSKRLGGTIRKTKETPRIAQNKSHILGTNQYGGITHDVTCSIDDRLKHMHIIGATGTGKSTLIANLIAQDIEQGIGLVLFDPHGDLIDDVIARIPEERLVDVVLIDPSDTDFPIGLNIIHANSDIEKEVLSSDLVSSFRKFATSWGDQMNAVLGNAIQAILEHKEGGTINDLRRFLIEKEFRNSYLTNVTDPSVKYYWQKEYPLLKTNSIGPILTRLDTFLRPKSIRNMVIQKSGVDFEKLLGGNKIILLKLSQGLIGMENSYLLGSLTLSKIHQAIFRRQQQAERNPIMLYLDEFQNFITPSIKEMLSGIRKYNVGLTLSHQDLQQLQRQDGELLNAVMGNSYSRIVFRVGEPDAKKLQDGFADFDFIDLQNLGRGQAVFRIEQPQYDCSLDTKPLASYEKETFVRKLDLVRMHSRKLYSMPKEAVETLLAESFIIEEKNPVIKNDIPSIPVIEAKEPLKEKEKISEIAKPMQPIPKKSDVVEKVKDISAHRYLQNLVKKMAEARGFTAILEQQIPSGDGQVDVLLTKEGKTMAIEICSTTDAQWETHNIEKCLIAQFDSVVSLSGDPKQLEKIKKKCLELIPDFSTKPVFFFTPDALFIHLDTLITETLNEEQIIKGYRVNVSYDTLTPEESQRKRASVTKVIMNSLKKKK